MDLVALLKTLPQMYDTFDSTGERVKLRVLHHIYFGDFYSDIEYSISVQASFYHYCVPRETLDLSEYTHFQVMLNIPDHDIPDAWEVFNYFGDNEYGYVPIDAIERLIEDLENKYTMKYKY